MDANEYKSYLLGTASFYKYLSLIICFANDLFYLEETGQKILEIAQNLM